MLCDAQSGVSGAKLMLPVARCRIVRLNIEISCLLFNNKNGHYKRHELKQLLVETGVIN